MLIASAILLAAIALFAVAYPIILRAQASQPAAASSQETLDELLGQRDAAYQALRELSFDHRVGKITDEDYGAFEAHLKQVAAAALRGLDAWEAETDDKLAPWIAANASRNQVSGRTLVSSRTAGGRTCPACGKPAAAEDKFCAACGAGLPVPSPAAAEAPAALACPACGQPYQPGDRFCAGCGRALSA